MRTKTAILSSALLLGALAVAAIGTTILPGGHGGSATGDTAASGVDQTAKTVNGPALAAAGAAGGFISQETITQATTSGANDTKRQQATVQIRVPAEKYTAVMSDLRGLAKEVTSENSQTSEVTGQYTDLQSQLRNLQST